MSDPIRVRLRTILAVCAVLVLMAGLGVGLYLAWPLNGSTNTTIIVPAAGAKSAPTVTSAPIINQNNQDNNPPNNQDNNPPATAAAPAPVVAPVQQNNNPPATAPTSGDNCGFVKIPVPCSSTPAPTSAPTSGNCGCAPGAYDPWTVMQEYYSYLDGSEFQQAWNMQGPSFQAANGGYASWAAGYAHTGMNHVYEGSESGDTVNLTLVARDTTTQEFQTFDCTYTVDTTSGLITAGNCTLESTQ